jgi:hypothetical protein
MSLRWKKFERTIRRRLGPFNARRHMRFTQRFLHWLESSPPIVVDHIRWLLTIIWIVTLRAQFWPSADAPVLFCVVSAWALLAATLRVGGLQQIGVIDPEYFTLWMLPMPADAIFRRVVRRLCLGSFWLFVEFAFAYWLIVHNTGQPIVSAGVALTCAALQLVLTIAITFAIAATNMRPEFLSVPAMVWTPIFIILAESWPPALVVGTASVNPFAWTNQICMDFVRTQSIAIGPLVLLFLAFATIPFTLWRLRELHRACIYRKAPVVVRGRPVMRREEPPPDKLAPTDAIASIRNDPWLQAVNWNNYSFIERVIGLILKPSEKPIAEILLLDAPQWRRNFIALVIRLAVFIFIGNFLEPRKVDPLARLFSNDPRAPIIAVLVLSLIEVFLVAHMLMIISRLFWWFSWPELVSARRNSGRSHTNFRLWPVNYWNALVVIAKINVVPLLAVIPVTIIFTLSAPWLKLEDLLASVNHPFFPSPVALALALWGSFLIPAHFLYAAFDEGRRAWLASLGNSAARLILSLVSFGAVMLRSTHFFLAVLFVVLSLGWFSWAGVRYRNGK